MNWRLKASWKMLALILALQVASFLPETAKGFAIEEDGRNPMGGDENQQPYNRGRVNKSPVRQWHRKDSLDDDYVPRVDTIYDYFEDPDAPMPEESPESAYYREFQNQSGDQNTPAKNPKSVQKRSFMSSWFPPKFVPSREKFRRSGRRRYRRGWFFNLGDSLGGERSYLRRHHPFCFSHGMSCTMAPNSCCNDSVCRCNLFGSNCKCDRPGLLFG